MNLSKHFKIVLSLLVVAAIILIGGYFWLKHRVNGGTFTGIYARPPLVLPSKDKELVKFNEKTHTLTVVTPTKTITEYAKNPTVEIRKNGDVVVQRHLTGFETDMFLGIGYSDTPRVFLGANLFHLSRFDLNASFAWTANNHYAAFRPYLGIGYNLYNNTSFNLAVDPISAVEQRADIAGFVSIKF